MQAERAERRINPHNWAYRQHFFGRTINPKKYNMLVKQYVEQQAFEFIENQCRVTQHIAVSSSLLTRRQREKYAARRVPSGRRTFYLFPIDSIPMDVFCGVNPQEGVYVYQSTDGR